MGGSNTKSVMPPKLLFVDRNEQARASPCDRATLLALLPLLYHQYHYYTTNITSISFQYHSAARRPGEVVADGGNAAAADADIRRNRADAANDGRAVADEEIEARAHAWLMRLWRRGWWQAIMRAPSGSSKRHEELWSVATWCAATVFLRHVSFPTGSRRRAQSMPAASLQ